MIADFEASQDRWLSEMMERPVLNVRLAHQPAGRLGDGALASRLREKLLQSSGVFAYAKVATHETATVDLLESVGFRIVDTNVTFEKLLDAPIIASPSSAEITVRAAHSNDEDGAAEVAAAAFRFSRFHLDPRIEEALAIKIKTHWVRNYFRGLRGDSLIVAVSQQRCCGFLQILNPAESCFVIDLIAVDPQSTRQGIASLLINNLEQTCGLGSTIRVGTQAANIASLRLYEKLGYRIQKTDYVLHYHAI
jgi:ribosomal protein S18 acetylase RimI-like enzyme